MRQLLRQPLLLFAALTTLWAGCSPASPVPRATQPGDPTAPPAETPMPETGIAQSDRARELAPGVAAEALQTLAAGNGAFATDLYQAVRGEPGNLFFSPYSVSLALAMTYAGARGETERQMAETLHFDLPQDQLHPAFNALDLALAGVPGATLPAEPTFRLNIANAIWGQAGYPFQQPFLDSLAVNYGAGLRVADFRPAAEREQARQAINDFVGQRTEGLIPQLLAPGILDENTRLVLVNAIYFKGEWTTPFDPNTQPSPFTLADGSQVSVPMMRRRAITGYAQGEAGGTPYEAVELAYKGNRIRMLVLLPPPGGLEALESALTPELVAQAAGALQPVDIALSLPRFSYRTSFGLADTLAGLGMPDAFAPGAADFSGMDGSRELYLTHVVHQAYVAVDELGTEAAAATGVVAGVTSMPQMVSVDRPFIYLIRDAETGTILFLGRVLNPAEA